MKIEVTLAKKEGWGNSVPAFGMCEHLEEPKEDQRVWMQLCEVECLGSNVWSIQEI